MSAAVGASSEVNDSRTLGETMQGDEERSKEINTWLNLQEHNLKGEPIFRVVLADTQFEMREGNFNEFYKDLFVRTVYGVKRTPKYPQLKNIWILEQSFDADRVQTESIKQHNGYECIYAFRDKKFNALPLRLDVVQLIIYAKHKARKSAMLTKSLLQAIEDEKERKSDQYIYDAIDPSSPIESALHFREGVSLAGLDIPDAKKSKDDTVYTSKSGQ